MIRHFAAMAIALAMPAAALADPAPPPPVDQASLAIATQIVEIALPPASRMEMMDRVTASMMKSMRANFERMPGMEDAGYKAIFDDYLNASLTSSHEMIAPMMPDLTGAMAEAYSRIFTRDELTQVLAFAHTQAGGHYLQRSINVMQDPAVQTVFTRLMATVQAHQVESVKALKERVTAYLAAHPDLAKQINSQNGK